MDGTALLASLKAGDLVLFAGNGLVRGLARWLRRGHGGAPPPNHMGLVIEGAGGERLLWEAPPPGRAVARGPQATDLTPLAERLAAQRGRVSVRRLVPALNAAQQAKLAALRDELAAAAAAHSLIDLMAAAEDGWVGADRDHLGAPLPGELVARAYQRLGLLDEGLPASHYTPAHFAERHGLALKRGFALGPELTLEPADPSGTWSDAAHPLPA